MRQLDRLKSDYPEQHLRRLEVENAFGYEAAQRLEVTWQKQQAFQQKIAQIAPAYHNLSETADTSLQARQTELLSTLFKGNEIRRARAVLKTYQR